jgi:hypothetical protein
MEKHKTILSIAFSKYHNKEPSFQNLQRVLVQLHQFSTPTKTTKTTPTKTTTTTTPILTH